MSIVGIVTHESPDMDATLCVWLLKRFGEARYPGISQVPVQFLPAGALPEGLDPDTLETTRGILAVDTGGGRLDTHARDGVTDHSRRDKSAALLVAMDLGIAQAPALERILRFVTLQETSGRSLASKEAMDHVMAIPNLMRGFNQVYYHAPERVLELMLEVYDALYATEQEWVLANADFSRAQILDLPAGRGRLVAIESSSTAAPRVARMHRADLVIHRNEKGHIGITGRHTGSLADLNFALLAEVLRVGEAMVGGESIDYPVLRNPGMSHGWYLHDSARILAKGSARNREVVASRLTQQELIELCGARLEARLPMPERLCQRRQSPLGGCLGCPFEPLQLRTCQRNRPEAP